MKTALVLLLLVATAHGQTKKPELVDRSHIQISSLTADERIEWDNAGDIVHGLQNELDAAKVTQESIRKDIIKGHTMDKLEGGYGFTLDGRIAACNSGGIEVITGKDGDYLLYTPPTCFPSTWTGGANVITPYTGSGTDYVVPLDSKQVWQ